MIYPELLIENGTSSVSTTHREEQRNFVSGRIALGSGRDSAEGLGGCRRIAQVAASRQMLPRGCLLIV